MARSTNARKSTGMPTEVEEPMLPIEAPRRQRNRIGKKTIAGKFDPAIARAFAILAVKEMRARQLEAEALEKGQIQAAKIKRATREEA